jgi:hypothetical protein
MPKLPFASAKKSAVAPSLLRRSVNTGPPQRGFAKYAAKIVEIDAWPPLDRADVDGSDAIGS